MLLVVLAALFCHFRSRTGGIYFLMSLNVVLYGGPAYLMGGPAGHTLMDSFSGVGEGRGREHGTDTINKYVLNQSLWPRVYDF